MCGCIHLTHHNYFLNHSKGRRQHSLPFTTFHKSPQNHLKGSVIQLVTFADISENLHPCRIHFTHRSPMFSSVFFSSYGGEFLHLPLDMCGSIHLIHIILISLTLVIQECECFHSGPSEALWQTLCPPCPSHFQPQPSSYSPRYHSTGRGHSVSARNERIASARKVGYRPRPCRRCNHTCQLYLRSNLQDKS